MRWNAALGALAASWGLIAVLAASVDLGAEALAFWRLALAAVTLGAVAIAAGRASLVSPDSLPLRTPPPNARPSAPSLKFLPSSWRPPWGLCDNLTY